jgi:hypothetical protein
MEVDQIQDMQEFLTGMVLHGHKLEQILMGKQLMIDLVKLFPLMMQEIE